MSTVSFLLDKALASHCFSQWLLAAFTFQIRCQSRRMNTAVNFADSLISGSLNPKYSVLPGGCQKWRGTHFWRNQDHMTVISSQLLSVQGLFPKPGKIRSWQDQQTYILYLYWCNRKPNGLIPLLLREGWFYWGWWHLLRSVYLPNSRSHWSLVSSPCPPSWQKWPVLFWKKKSFSLATLRNTLSPFSVLLSSSSSFLCATLSLGSQLELASFAHFINLTLFTWVPARFSGQLSRNVAVTEDQKWSNCVIA